MAIFIIALINNRNKQLLLMKRVQQVFDYDSHSTQQRQRRFSRTNNSRSNSGNSTSSRHKDQSISKFWVKDLKIQASPRLTHIQSALTKNIDKNSQWSPPKRKPTPVKAQRQRKTTLTKEQLIQMQERQIKELNEQIDKYHIYIKRQNQRLQAIIKQNAKVLSEKIKIQQNLIVETKKSVQLQKQIESFQAKIYQKDLLIDLLQKQQTSLQKVKTSIVQNRTLQYQKQKQQLNKKIRNLQIIIQNQKLERQKSALYPSNTNLRTLSSHNRSKTQNDFNFTVQSSSHLEDMEKQLYNSRQQVKRLLILQGCLQMKHSKQLQILRKQKQKQYQGLKNKFTQFLKKYKLNMMKITTSQIRNSKSLRIKRSQSLQSMESLILSSDDEVEESNIKLNSNIGIKVCTN